jgi:DNA-binding transcriptional regulator YiaG
LENAGKLRTHVNTAHAVVFLEPCSQLFRKHRLAIATLQLRNVYPTQPCSPCQFGLSEAPPKAEQLPVYQGRHRGLSAKPGCRLHAAVPCVCAAIRPGIRIGQVVPTLFNINIGRRSVAKLEVVMKEAIARGARKQVRGFVTPLRREVLRLRRKVAELHGTVTTLQRSAASWDRVMKATPLMPPVSEAEAKTARLSARLIGSLRRRLGLSQLALAHLVGVSGPAVAHWESGTSTPTGKNRVSLVALRKLGKQQVRELLARRSKEQAPRMSRSRKRRRRRPPKRSR